MSTLAISGILMAAALLLEGSMWLAMLIRSRKGGHTARRSIGPAMAARLAGGLGLAALAVAMALLADTVTLHLGLVNVVLAMVVFFFVVVAGYGLSKRFFKEAYSRTRVGGKGGD